MFDYLSKFFQRSVDKIQRGGSSRRMIVGLAGALISLLFVVFAVYREWDELIVYLRASRPEFLGIALLLYPIGFIPTALLWHRLMVELQGCKELATNLHHFGWSCLPKRIPGVIWYVAGRVMLYRESDVNASVTLTATALEALFLIVSGLLLFSVSVMTGYVQAHIDISVYVVIVCIVVIVLVLVFWRRVLSFLFHLFKADPTSITQIRFSWWRSLGILGICMAGWIGGGALLWLVAHAVVTVPLQSLPAYVGIWAGAAAVSLLAGFLLQGLGLREITLAALLLEYMPMSVAVAVAVLFRVLLTVGEFAWAVVLVKISPLFARITRR